MIQVEDELSKITFLFKSDMLKHKRTIHDKPTHMCSIGEGVLTRNKGLKVHRQKPCRINTRHHAD